MTAEMRAEMECCAKMGTPRPESSAVRARSKADPDYWASKDQVPNKSVA